MTAAVYILGENPSEEVDDDENDNYYQHLMLHPYITSSRTIINIVLSYVELGLDTKRPVASLVKGGLLYRYMPSHFYPSSVVLFQLHGGMVSQMQELVTHFSTVYNTKYLDPYL